MRAVMSNSKNLSINTLLNKALMTLHLASKEHPASKESSNQDAQAYESLEKRLLIIEKKMNELNAANTRFIIGGDFNNLPPNSVLYCDFDDNACTEASGYEPQACDVLLEELSNMNIFLKYDAAIPQAKYESNQPIFGTFTSDKNGFWNRKLDYIFTNGDFVANSGLVHQGISSGGIATMPLSDHAPITTVYRLNK